MEFRSPNDNGYSHHQGDLVTNVSSGGAINSSHGVHLTGGSTGGIVQPAGDEANIALNVRGKGTGSVILGNSSQSVQFGTSTAAISGTFRYVVEFTPAVLAVNAQSESTITVTGLTTNAGLTFTARTAASPLYLFGVRCSSVGELRLNQYNGSGSTIGTGESTSRGVLTETRFA